MNEYPDYRESWGALLQRVLRNALLAALGLGAVAAAACWLLGWRTLFLVGQGLLIAGGLALGLGLLSTVGSYTVRGSFNYQYSRTASHQTSGERAAQDMRDVFANNAFMITTLLAGMLLALVGYLLQMV